MSTTNPLVRRLEAPRSGDKSQSIQLNAPTWIDIEQAILKLDGGNCCEVALQTTEASGMSISGGYQGRVICEIIESSESQCLLANPSGDSESEIAIDIAESLQYPSHMVVDKHLAICAAKAFYVTGKPSDEFMWAF